MDREEWMMIAALAIIISIVVAAIGIGLGIEHNVTIKRLTQERTDLQASRDAHIKDAERWFAVASGRAADLDTANARAGTAQTSAIAAQVEVDNLRTTLISMSTDLRTARRHNNQASELVAKLRKAYDVLVAQHDALSRAYVAACQTKEQP